MRKIFFSLVIILVFKSSFLTAQKTVSELTLMYDNTVETKSDKPNIGTMLNGATTTIFIKQSSHRTEQVNSLGNTTTIFDGKTNTAVILKEFGKQKILVRLTSKNWDDMNKRYTGTTFTKTNDTKTIAGYTCIKYTGKTTDGKEFIVYATTDLTTENKTYNSQFKDVDGLVLEYEITSGSTKITTTASKIIVGTVLPNKFEIPKSGYREMTYEESIK